MSLGVTDFFILFSVLQGGIVGCAILLHPYFRSCANNYLGGSVLLLSFVCFMGWQDFGLFWLDYLWWHMWELLVPVPLFIYILLVLKHRYLKARWLPWLYVPFVVSVVVGVFFDLSFTFGLFELPIAQEGPEYRLYNNLEDAFSFWFNVFLVGWGLLLAREDQSLPLEKKRWLIQFASAMLVVLLTWYLSVSISESYGSDRAEIAIWVALSFLFWWICYTGVYRLRIRDDQLAIHRILNARQPITVPEGDNETGKYPAQLSRLMHEEQVYRNPDLSRSVIAERLGISDGYLSEIINGKVGESFADYVNGFRVRAARDMLADPTFDPYSLEAIGLEAGFKSRSAFYSTFKKVTGLTPGDYRKAPKTS